MAAGSPKVILPRAVRNKARAETAQARFTKGATIPVSRQLTAEDVKSLRSLGQIVEALRKLARTDGTVSSAVFAYVQVADSGFSVKAYQPGTHQFDQNGTLVARSVMASMDTLYDYTRGFSDKPTTDTMLTTMLREAVLTGAVAGELVLDRLKLPQRINVIPYETLRWKSDGNGGKYPEQIGARERIDLNIPTFWVAEMQKEADTAYASSMLEAALNSTFYFLEFIEDMRRSVRRAGHSRLTVSLNAASVREAAPPEVREDPAKLQAFLDQVKKDVEDALAGVEPEDAIVTYDTATVEQLPASGEKGDYTALLNALSGVLATSLKSHPSILGLRLAGSQSLSNTESLIFLKNIRAIQKPVEDVMSRALTLATRLMGADVYVKFRFNSVDLRPKAELEAFRTMEQNRVLELLSLGFITDEEAAERLGTGPRPAGAPPLSGTMFMQSQKAPTPTPNSDPMGRALQPDTPSNPSGGQSK